MPVKGLLAELEWRGLVHQVTDPALARLLDERTVTAYGGFDPTSDSLTIGNLMLIVSLMRVQRAGHRPIALAGGGTGMIGDPSGRTDERQLLTPDVLAANLEAIRAQLSRFLDFGADAGEARAELLDNGQWLGTVGLLEFLRDVGKHFTVNAMVAKDSVRARFAERDRGISFTEFSYMLLQAYDFWYLHTHHGCDLQLGGSDQWGNITAGIDLIRRRNQTTAYGLTFPLVTRADGVKFGKSEGVNIWLDPARTSPYALYQFLVRTEDTMVGTYLRYFTFRTGEEIAALDEATRSHPERRDAQRALAADVVTLVHGAGERERAERASAALFTDDIAGLDESTLLAVMADAPSSELSRAALEGDGIEVIELLVRTGLEASRGSARGMVAQGGIYLNNQRVGAADERVGRRHLLHDRYLVLRRGRAVHVVRVG